MPVYGDVRGSMWDHAGVCGYARESTYGIYVNSGRLNELGNFVNSQYPTQNLRARYERASSRIGRRGRLHRGLQSLKSSARDLSDQGGLDGA